MNIHSTPIQQDTSACDLASLASRRASFKFAFKFNAITTRKCSLSCLQLLPSIHQCDLEAYPLPYDTPPGLLPHPLTFSFKSFPKFSPTPSQKKKKKKKKKKHTVLHFLALHVLHALPRALPSQIPPTCSASLLEPDKLVSLTMRRSFAMTKVLLFGSLYLPLRPQSLCANVGSRACDEVHI